MEVKGVYRFLEKTSSFFDTASQSQINAEHTQNFAETQNNAEQAQNDAEMEATRGHSLRRSEATGKGMTSGSAEENKSLLSLLHKTIKGVTKDIEKLKFNTAISKLMIFINTATASRSQNIAEMEKIMEKFLILLSPFAPFLAEKLWQQLGHQDSIFDQQWPKYNSDLIKDELITMVIQINGKVRDNVQVPVDITKKEAHKLAISREKIKKWTTGQEIKKVIFVKGRLVNIVMK
ncbi:MAG: class I tRNA ligase family protein [Xanthomonadaceae bacterium]|nr:class I tRNA ligase family protein [Rhodospirillaceae bacterium]NIA18073.1 class I tRNA ligase family protein [Xanthomonadaceae bacterium]